MKTKINLALWVGIFVMTCCDQQYPAAAPPAAPPPVAETDIYSKRLRFTASLKSAPVWWPDVYILNVDSVEYVVVETGHGIAICPKVHP